MSRERMFNISNIRSPADMVIPSFRNLGSWRNCKIISWKRSSNTTRLLTKAHVSGIVLIAGAKHFSTTRMPRASNAIRTNPLSLANFYIFWFRFRPIDADGPFIAGVVTPVLHYTMVRHTGRYCLHGEAKSQTSMMLHARLQFMYLEPTHTPSVLVWLRKDMPR